MVDVTTLWSGAQTSDGSTATAKGPGPPLTCSVTAADSEAEVVAQATVQPAASQTELQGATLQPLSPVFGDVLSCLAVGATDPCGAVAVTAVTWWVGPDEVGQQPTLDTSNLNAGDSVWCQLEVAAPGGLAATATSAPATVQSPPQEAPLVAIEAPSGADGPVTCQVTQPGTPGLELEVRWQLGDASEFVGDVALAPDVASHCDRVRCRMVVVGGPASNTAEIVLPVGDDCDDANVCIAEICGPIGGCSGAPTSQPCDDGLSCTTQDTCSDSGCVGVPVECADQACSASVCVEGEGCVAVPIEAGCDDGSVCTLADICVAGACQGSQPLAIRSPAVWPKRRPARVTTAIPAPEATRVPTGRASDWPRTGSRAVGMAHRSALSQACARPIPRRPFLR
jgi:hypothetical protein